MVFGCALLVAGIHASAQTVTDADGAQMCSHKKQLLVAAPAVAGPNSPRHSFDVLNYTLEMDIYRSFFSPYPKDFEAMNTVRFRVDTALSAIDLDAVNSSLVVNSVGLSGSTYTHTNDILHIVLDRIYEPGEVVDVSIAYAHNNVEDAAFYAGNGHVFTDNEPEGARHWFPCWDKPSDKATTDITARVPASARLGSNGLLADSTIVGDTLIYHWISRDPLPTYLAVLSSRTDYNLDIIYWQDPENPDYQLPIRFYSNPGEDPSWIQQRILPMVTHFSGAYGEFPFEKDGYASLNSQFTWGGMENQSLTSLCQNCWYEGLVSHEFAHQWFGDMISPATWSEIWLNEGFATWSEAYWKEAEGGYSAYKSSILNRASNYLGNNPGWPIFNPDWAINTPPNSILFNTAITYSKSACVIHQLRYILGDEKFFQAIHDYATDTNYRYKSVKTVDFIDRISESAGEDLHWYLDSWLNQPNHPVYANEYYFVQLAENQWEVHFDTRQTQTNAGFFPMDLNIYVLFTDLTDTVYRVRNLVNNESFVFTSDKEPGFLSFDNSNEIVLKQASLIVGLNGQLIGDSQMKAIPNPASNTVMVSAVCESASTLEFKLINTTGVVVYTQAFSKQQANPLQFNIDVGHLPSGMYTLIMQSNSSTVARKILVLH